MINLMVDDLARVPQLVTLGGATFVGEPLTQECGRFGWFMDPVGNRVELRQLNRQ
jgi:predicted enzyme related to lactoylglutathione lyase